MTSNDVDAFEYYDEPAHRKPAAGEPRRRGARPPTRQVPVRFPADAIESVRPLAQTDGMSVSTWIRRAVELAIRQRQRP